MQVCMTWAFIGLERVKHRPYEIDTGLPDSRVSYCSVDHRSRRPVLSPLLQTLITEHCCLWRSRTTCDYSSQSDLVLLFRYLYWGQGASKAGIFRSDLDGSDVIDVATASVEQPTGMTLGE